ncbi:MAG: phosphatase PAP2 family protein [Candidatus Thorarchaeota archaeon]
MSEKKGYLSDRGLMVIGIVSLVIFVVGIILCYNGLNEEFYSESSTIRAIFKAITYLGEPIVFLVIIVVIFLGYNKILSKNLLLSILVSYYVNEWVKEIFQDDRPNTNIDTSEDYDLIEPSYGFPSGHSQNSVAYWGYLGYEFKDKFKYKEIPIIPIILSSVIFLVAISRIIIGVHDLQDIIGGLIIGIGVLLLFIYLEPILSEQFNKLNIAAKIILTICISVGLFLFGTLLFPKAGLGLASTPKPPSYADEGAFGLVGGVLLGFGVGYILEQQYVKYNPSSLPNKTKILNVLVGLVIALAIFVPLEYILEFDSVFYRYFRYALIAFIISYVIPLLCVKINK